jgi:hypothetical protein
VAFAGGDTPIALSAFQFFKRDPEHDRERKQVQYSIAVCFSVTAHSEFETPNESRDQSAAASVSLGFFSRFQMFVELFDSPI